MSSPVLCETCKRKANGCSIEPKTVIECEYYIAEVSLSAGRVSPWQTPLLVLHL